MTVSSAFTISRRTESFDFSSRRICIGMCEWVPHIKSLRSRGTSRPESNRNVDETPGWLPPDVHGLRAMSRGLGNQMDLADLPADRDEILPDGRSRLRLGPALHDDHFGVPDVLHIGLDRPFQELRAGLHACPAYQIINLREEFGMHSKRNRRLPGRPVLHVLHVLQTA